ncbi:MAG TPA: hypothetical protein VLX44_11220 [Xanthobacteraceae bacterium]|nr:hypothetical protein [Xanthobacteraceae bacterium]
MPGNPVPSIVAKINQYLAKKSTAKDKQAAVTRKSRPRRETTSSRKKAARAS